MEQKTLRATRESHRMMRSLRGASLEEASCTIRRPFVRRQARPGWVSVDFAELWHYRELLLFQALRDIKVRYKQTALGAAWAILQPILTMAAFTIFFGRLAGVPSDGVPYPIFTFSALLPWQLFAFALTQSSNSLVDNAAVLTKVYFPRLILPFASVLAGLVDFTIACVVMAGMILYYGVVPGWEAMTLPLFTLLALAAALAVGLWLSALNVRYRDVRYTIPFLAQFWMYASPVVYPVSLVPEKWRLLYSLNPTVGVIEGFRWALLSKGSPDFGVMAASGVVIIALLLGGIVY